MEESPPERVAGSPRRQPAFGSRNRIKARAILFVSVFFAFVVLAGIFAAASTPVFESKFTLVPVDQADLIRNWFASRNASEIVAVRYEAQIAPVLFPGSWDSQGGTWRGEPPPRSQQGEELRHHVRLRLGSPETETDKDRFLQVIVTFEDATIARVVAEGYLRTLADLRPILENITRQEAADRYYRDAFFQGGTEEANRRAETYARNRTFWIILDAPASPTAPAGPAFLTIVGIGAALGLLVGALAVPIVDRFQHGRGKRL